MGNQTTGLHLLQPNKQPRETFVPTLNERETEGGKKAASASVHIHLNADADSRTPQVSGGREEKDNGLFLQSGTTWSLSSTPVGVYSSVGARPWDVQESLAAP